MEYNCGKCSKADEVENMVACDECQVWYHMSCAHVNESSVVNREFICDDCCSRKFTKSTKTRHSVDKNTPQDYLLMPDLEKSLSNLWSEAPKSYDAVLKHDQACFSDTTKTKAEDKELQQQNKLLLQLQTAMKEQENRFIKESKAVEKRHKQLMKASEKRWHDEVRELRTRLNHGLSVMPSAYESPKQSHPSKPTRKHHKECYSSEDSDHESVARRSQRFKTSDFHQSTFKHSEPVGNTVEVTLFKMIARQALPELPEFSGTSKEWPYFQLMYEQKKEAGGYTPIECVGLLRKALTGRAKESVQDIISSIDSAEEVMKVLKFRFGRPIQVITELIKEINTLKEPKNSPTSAIIMFGQKIKNLVTNIKSMGCSDHLRNPSLIADLEYKLRESTRISWASYKRERKLYDPDLQDFSKFLQTHVDNAIDLGQYEPQREFKAKHSVNVTNEVPVRKIYKCVICKKGNHQIANCEIFKSMGISKRWMKLKELHLRPCCFTSEKHKTTHCPQLKEACGVDGCSYYHHKLMHNEKKPFKESEVTEADASQSKYPNIRAAFGSAYKPQRSSAPENLCHTRDNNKPKLFKIIELDVTWKNKTIKVNAFLDDGASPTVIDKSLFNELDLDGTKDSFVVQYAKGDPECEEGSMVTSLFVSIPGTKRRFRLNHVHTAVDLNLPNQTINADNLRKTYAHLADLPLKDVSNSKPRILIGLEHAHLIASFETRAGKPDEPLASRTQLGWIVYGKHCTYNEENSHRINFVCECIDNFKTLHDEVKSFFTTESLGVMPQAKALISKDDEQAQKIVKSTMKQDGNHYEIGLFWKHDHVQLPNSYNMAYKRLLCLEHKMKKDIKYANWINDKIQEYVNKGYARLATADDLETSWQRVSYIPIFSVLNINKDPPKERLVFDFAAKTNGISVNSMLVTGPDLLPSIVGVLCKTREKAIAVGADVEEMFSQVKIKLEDQQCQRFLFRNGDDQRLPDVYVLQSMGFGPTCSPASAQLIKNHHANKYIDKYPDAVDAITKQTYVDDYMNSHDDVSTAVDTAKHVITIFKDAGFNLRSFISNSKEFINLLPPSNVKGGNSNFSLDIDSERSFEKVLGLHWNTASDKFVFKMNKRKIDQRLFEVNRRPTKAEVLRTVMQIFDPLGLISFYTVRAKVLLQDVWRSGTDWDEPIPLELYQKWLDWFTLLPDLQELKIPRRLSPWTPNKCEIEMHTFVDASDGAFAANTYLRFKNNGDVHVTLVSAKTRVAPLKMLSTPKKELQAAVMGARLAATMKKEHRLKITNQTYWSDSKVVLAWIRSDHRRFQQFVSVRVGEILTLTEIEEWRHVPTKLNVADDGTKWDDKTLPDINNRWFNGPEFLKFHPESWPQETEKLVETEEEIKKIMILRKPVTSFSAIDDGHFSSYRRLVRTTAFVIRFITRNYDPYIKFPVYLTVHELKKAESVIIKKAQFESFPAEFTALHQGNAISNKSKLYKFSLKLDDCGVMRIDGRIKNACGIQDTTKSPAILPQHHHISELIVTHLHNKNFHQGQETIVWKSRLNYWIIQVRNVVKKVQRLCPKCIMRRAKPTAPLMGQLPQCRLTTGKKPFTYVGIDFFGPLAVTVGRSRQKRWGMILVCMVTRAIHVELVEDMTSSSCIIGLRNFICRRGVVEEIWSDNGTNLRGAETELRQALIRIECDLGKVAAEDGIIWHFNPPGAPHFGGIWERLIQIVKKCLYVTLKEESPRVEVLRNALIEAENIVNSRPLTNNPIESIEESPLTPNAILVQSNQMVRVPVSIEDSQNNHKIQWIISQRIANNFWKRWSNECLPLLTRRSKWFENVKNIEVNDLVYIIDPNTPRGDWKKGLVTKVYPGADGIVRAATVRTATNKYTRPTAKLALIECRQTKN